MLILITSVGIVLISSGICSGAEAALFSVPIIKAKQLADTKKTSALMLLKIRQNMSSPISTLVVLNNISNIVGSIVVGGIAMSVLGNKWIGIFSGGLTFFVIIFSEIIPKTLGERHAETISLFIAKPLAGITKIFTPILWIIEKITMPITKGKATAFTTNEAEIKLLARIGQEEGVIDSNESNLIQRAFKLDDLMAVDLMTPRVEMTYLNGQSRLRDIQGKIVNSPHSRIVVIEETADNVVGVVLKDELLAAIVNGKDESDVSTFIHKIHFVAESTRADKLLSIFQQTRQHLAIVVDEYTAVRGVVTLEDVLEVLTGEIVDETDRDVDLQAVARDKFKKLPVE